MPKCSSIETFLRLQMRAIGKFECRDVFPSFHFDARNPHKSFLAAPDKYFVVREKDLSRGKLPFH